MEILHLHKRYPVLAQRFGRTPLGKFPTPVEKLNGLCTRLNRDFLYVKRDDLSGETYGGNKVRKLEFLLYQAQHLNASTLITSGGAGSNHCLATAIYGKKLHFKVVLMLFEQPNSNAVRENLLADYYSDAQMHLDPDYTSHRKSMQEVIKQISAREGRPPYVIPPGGTSLIGTIGYVNAAFELKEQIRQGLLQEPSEIFIPFGTMGTAAGLLLGCKVAGIKSHINAVRVVPTSVADKEKFLALFSEVNRALHDADRSFPVCSTPERDITIIDEYFGPGYGIFTRKSNEAVHTAWESDQMRLDGTYTGKTFAAFLQKASELGSKRHTLLFWDTKNSQPLQKIIIDKDYTKLPEPFHHYFTDPVQDTIQTSQN